MTDTAWKALERRVARALGGERAGPRGGAVSDVVGVPFSVEVKRTKRGTPEARHIVQARHQGQREGKPWILVTCAHGSPRPLVTLDFRDFAEIAQDAGRLPIPLEVVA